MDKGIRINVNAKFKELLVERNAQPADSKTRNKEFRRDVMTWAISEFDISIASAATHYNHALKLAQKEIPAQVEGLGRPEDKKGGRKKKIVAETTAAVNGEGESPDKKEGEAEEAHTFTTVEPATFVVKKKKDNTVVAEGLTLAQAQELCGAAKAAKKATLIWE